MCFWFLVHIHIKNVYFVLLLVPRRNAAVSTVGLKIHYKKINFGIIYSQLLHLIHYWRLLNMLCLVWPLKFPNITTFVAGTLLGTGPSCCVSDCSRLPVKVLE